MGRCVVVPTRQQLTHNSSHRHGRFIREGILHFGLLRNSIQLEFTQSKRSVIIEVIFGIPGMGSYIFESITLRDYNAVMAVLLMSSTLTLIGMLLSDLSYALVDPRITFE